MKLTDPKKVTIDEVDFYIYPFKAFKAAYVSGELVKLVSPLLGGLSALAGTGENGKSIFDSDLEKIAPAVAGAFNSLSGEAVEKLLRQLLTDNNNVAFTTSEGKTVYLSEDAINEIFCGEIQNLYLLAFEVIRVNYGSFFEKLGNRFGIVSEKIKETMKSVSTAPSITNNSEN